MHITRIALRAAVAAALATCLLGCTIREAVVRTAGGRLVEGQAVEPETYAALVRAELLEAKGAFAEAEAELRAALDESGDAELWVRVARVRRARGDLGGAARAVGSALDGAPDYGPAWGELGQIALARDDRETARRAFTAARSVDATSPAWELRLLALEGYPLPRATALAGHFPADPSVWRGLAEAAERGHDDALVAHAMVEVARRAAEAHDDCAVAAERLAARGDIAGARTVAAAAADAASASGRHLASALAARLAVDEALARGDGEASELRAARAQLAPTEVAARAILLGKFAIARAIAEPLVDTPPYDGPARLLLATLEPPPEALRAGAQVLANGARDGIAPLDAASFAVVARWLGHVLGDDAEAVSAVIARRPPVSGDALVGEAMGGTRGK